MNKLWTCFSVFCLITFIAAPLSAYERTTTLSGIEIFWARYDIPVKIHISTQFNENQLKAALKGLEAWNIVPTSYFQFDYEGQVSKAQVENDGLNLILFNDVVPGGTIAQASTFYLVDSGQIIESDMELNSALTWSVNGEENKVDIQSIITHEAGHIIGLDDLYLPSYRESTMYASAVEGETKKRTLAKDDEEGVTAIYPVSQENTYSISGRIYSIYDDSYKNMAINAVRDKSSELGDYYIADEPDRNYIDGVVVTLDGAAEKSDISENGYYTFHNLSAGNYKITPTLDGYSFDPVFLTIQISNDHALRQDFAIYNYNGGQTTLTQNNSENNTTTEAITSSSDGSGSGGCYIASFAYGADSSSVALLKSFRDEYLLSSELGNTFVESYYLLSPRLVALLEGSSTAAAAFRSLLSPLVYFCRALFSGFGFAYLLPPTFAFFLLYCFNRGVSRRKIAQP